MDVRVGTCGWSFDDWRGPFYPPGSTDRLAFYATQFDAVEIDGTWYQSPTPNTVRSWQRRCPEGFILCPKLLGEITHEHLLEGPQEPLVRFLDAIGLSGDKLGPILVQLSPKFAANRLRVLRAFLAGLPETFRYAVEFRHPSWPTCKDAFSLTSDLGMAVVMADHPTFPRIERVTAQFVYVRLLGRRGVFPDYSQIHRARDEDLRKWAEMLQGLPAQVEQAFVFINNQFEGHSPASARKLLTLLGEPPGETAPSRPGAQPTLFD